MPEKLKRDILKTFAARRARGELQDVDQDRYLYGTLYNLGYPVGRGAHKKKKGK